MKNFKSDGFKKGGNRFAYGNKSQSGGDYRPAGRHNTGRPPRDERHGDRQELFKTTCTTCGRSCEVPFRPDGIKPVLCKDCFAKKNPQENGVSHSPRNFAPSERPDFSRKPEFKSEAKPVFNNSADYKLVIKQMGEIEVKVNQILKSITKLEAMTTAPVAVAEKVVEKVIAEKPVKLSKVKKTAPKKVAKKEVKKVAKKVEKNQPKK